MPYTFPLVYLPITLYRLSCNIVSRAELLSSTLRLVMVFSFPRLSLGIELDRFTLKAQYMSFQTVKDARFYSATFDLLVRVVDPSYQKSGSKIFD